MNLQLQHISKSLDVLPRTQVSVQRVYLHRRPVNLHPLFLKIGHPAFWKKQSAKNQGHCNSKREEAAWSLLFLNKEWPCFFQPAFCKKQGAPFFKKQGARFLRIVGADWLGECLYFKKSTDFIVSSSKSFIILKWFADFITVNANNKNIHFREKIRNSMIQNSWNYLMSRKVRKSTNNITNIVIQWNLDLRKPDLRKNLDLRKIVATTDFLVHKLCELRNIF